MKYIREKILSGDDSRKLIIVGPCSADRKRQSLNTLADYESYLTKYTTGFLFSKGIHGKAKDVRNLILINIP